MLVSGDPACTDALPAAGFPWEQDKRSPIRVMAVPHLASALRRLIEVELPKSTKIPEPIWISKLSEARWTRLHNRHLADIDVVDRPHRLTRRRIAFAISWNASHPACPMPYMYNLQHACWLAFACGVTPSRFIRFASAGWVTRFDDDETLLKVAYLAMISDFDVSVFSELVTDAGWTVPMFIAWSERYDQDHFEGAVMAGWQREELGALVLAGEVPDASQVEFMAAMRREPVG